MINRILPLAEEFLMLGIKRTCEKALLSYGKFDLNSVVLADCYNLPRLRESALEYIGNKYSFRSLLNDELFKKLEGSSKSQILEKRIRHVFGRLPRDVEQLLLDYERTNGKVNISKVKEKLVQVCTLEPHTLSTDKISSFGLYSTPCW